MTLDETVAKEGILQKIGNTVKKSARALKIGGYMILTGAMLTACDSCEGDDPKPDQDYKITINADSKLADKYIKDGTTAFFVEAGNDTIFANTIDEKAIISVHAESGREITGIAGIKDNKGHYGTKQNITLMGNEELLLEMNGKTPTTNIGLTTTYNKGTATNIKITINPGNVVTTTDENGKANIEYENETNEYNEISTNATIKAESTPSSNIQTQTQNYTRTIDSAIENWEFELTQSEYEHNYSGNVNSSLAEKIIKDGIEKIGLVYDSEITDTTWNNINNQTYAITKISGNENENYTLIFKGIPGHENKKITGTSTSGNEEINDVELIGLIYDANIPIQVTEQGTSNGVAGATVDETETTNTEGKTTITRKNLETDINNIPLTSYATNVSVSKAGYIPKSEELTYIAGENTEKTIEIEKEIVSNTYTEKIIFANETADTYDNGLVFVIKTLSDNQEHTFNVNSTEQVQELTLEGPYETNENIEIYFTAASASAAGKEDKIMTIIRNYQQPTASNGTRTSTLSTTLEEVFNEVNDTTWILSMNTTLYDDVAFRTHLNGGKEWIHSENGKRTMNINEITRELDINTGTYGANITTEELTRMQDRTRMFDNNFWERNTGLKILNVNFVENPNYETTAGNVNIYYDRTEIQPGNTHYQTNTTRPNTHDGGDGFVDYFRGAFSPEIFQAINYVEDYLGASGDIMSDDTNQDPVLHKPEIAIVNMTYVGGQAPDN